MLCCFVWNYKYTGKTVPIRRNLKTHSYMKKVRCITMCKVCYYLCSLKKRENNKEKYINNKIKRGRMTIHTFSKCMNTVSLEGRHRLPLSRDYHRSWQELGGFSFYLLLSFKLEPCITHLKMIFNSAKHL